MGQEKKALLKLSLRELKTKKYGVLISTNKDFFNSSEKKLSKTIWIIKKELKKN